MTKIEMIQRSNHCLVLVGGVWYRCWNFLARFALIERLRVRRASRWQWNPAAIHLRWGVAVAGLGCVISLVAMWLVATAVANN